MEKEAVQTGLPDVGAPFEWAVRADGILYTSQVPVRRDGTFESGDERTQIELTFENLRETLARAGGTLADVTQVLVYLTDPTYSQTMNEIYRRFFSPPFPNRATFVTGLTVPGAIIEIIAYAHLRS